MSLAKIGNKIFKKEVELSRDVVELFDILDLMGISKNINNLSKIIEPNLKSFITAKDSLENDIVPLDLNIANGEKALKEVSGKIKELGLKPNQVPELKVLEAAIKEGRSLYKDVKTEM